MPLSSSFSSVLRKVMAVTMTVLAMLLVGDSTGVCYALKQQQQQERVPTVELTSTKSFHECGIPVSFDNRYTALITMYYLPEKDFVNDLKPAGWTTRAEDGANKDAHFAFTPGIVENPITQLEGWDEAITQMKVGQRALIRIPSKLAYGSEQRGSPEGTFYIPPNSDVILDVEVLAAV